MGIEEALGITIGEAETSLMVTVGDLETIVLSKLGPDTDRAATRETIVRAVRERSGTIHPVARQTTFYPDAARPRRS